MFDVLFGWRKASKCKKLIKRVQCRLKLLKNKRQSIVRQLRTDVAHLIKIGRADIALNRAEHLYKDNCIVAAYDLLDNFCEFILIQLPYIRKHKDCPNDVSEAVSSLIFASARCGDLPELRMIRDLFGERYGKRFEKTALELMPGNLVNLQVKEKLSTQSVPLDVKRTLVNEIARDYCIQPEILALEYASELNREVVDKDIHYSDSKTKGSKVGESLRTSDREGTAATLGCASTNLSSKIPSPSDPKCDEISSSVSYASHQSSPQLLESPLNKKAETIETTDTIVLEHGEDQKIAASSSESLPQFLEEEGIVYLDDIEEVQSCTTTEGSCQDQRIFKFKSSEVPKKEKIKNSYYVGYVGRDDSSSDRSKFCKAGKRVKTTRKRLTTRFVSQVNSSSKDINYVVYYDRTLWRYPSQRNRRSVQSKYRKKYSTEICKRLSSEENILKPPHPCHCFDLEAEHCCLKHPCYLRTDDFKYNHEIPHLKRSREISIIHSSKEKHKSCKLCNLDHSMDGESDSGIERYIFPGRPRRRSCGFDALRFGYYTNHDYQHEKQNKTVNAKVSGLDSPVNHAATKDVYPEASHPLTTRKMRHPYLRATTMPQERPKENEGVNVFGDAMRTRSLPIQSPGHVHPKLPDYDAIAAQFMALKKEHVQKKESWRPIRF